MRNEIIQALEYPRLLIGKNLEIDSCIHSGLYDCNDKRCSRCSHEDQCMWIYQNDTPSAQQQKSDQKLLSALGLKK